MNKNITKHIKVFILAGGLGSRLAPILSGKPKGLAPIGKKSFLEIMIEILRYQGFYEFVFLVGHKADNIIQKFGNGYDYGVKIEYSSENPNYLLGTAGAIKNAENLINERVLLLNGDTFFDIDYNYLVKKHLENLAKHKCKASISLTKTNDISEYGFVKLMSGNKITGFHEKTPVSDKSEGWVNAGVYILEKEILNYVPPGKKYSLELGLFPKLLVNNIKLCGVKFDNRFFDIGTPYRLEEFLKFYMENYEYKN